MNNAAVNMPAYFEESETAAHQDLQTYGFWLYLMSDLILFAALFATYGVLAPNTAGGPSGKNLFDLPYVLAETLLLLCSTTTFGFSMHAMDRKKSHALLFWLFVTFLLGAGFVSMEVNEFTRLIMDGNGPERSGFLSAFFTLVGTHGCHVFAGLVWIAVMMVQVISKGLTLPVQSRLTRLGMFWHFLDIVWVCVFTIVYLMGVL